MTKLHTAMSRYADKFVVRMPDDMRGKFVSLAKQRAISMNTAIIQGLTSYLDSLEELRILIEGNRLLRKSLIEKQEALGNLRTSPGYAKIARPPDPSLP